EEAARRVVGNIADKLGFSVERTAQGILDIVAANMVRAIRAISVERGHDPRNFVLMPFGGAGPLHAGACARALGISEIIVPFSPGILSAQGLLVTDLSESWVRSKRLAGYFMPVRKSRMPSSSYARADGASRIRGPRSQSFTRGSLPTVRTGGRRLPLTSWR